MREIRILTLQEPWATLVASGRKPFETRTWSTTFRDFLAVHAGRTVQWAAVEKLRKLGVDLPTDFSATVGRILAVAKLRDCRPLLATKEDVERATCLGVDERRLAEYFGGPFDGGPFLTADGKPIQAWCLEDVVRIPPILFKGMQGLRPVPPELLDDLRGAYRVARSTFATEARP